MKIYTGRGDEGMTDLRDMSRVSKSSHRIEAYGTIDELNALIGTIRPVDGDELESRLQTVQNHLHVLLADLSNPDPDAEDPVIREAHVDVLEGWIDDIEADLEPLDSFVLPGGGETGASLHHARAVCRRAERRTVACAAQEPINDLAVVYLNRLSDVLFVFARQANRLDGIEAETPSY